MKALVMIRSKLPDGNMVKLALFLVSISIFLVLAAIGASLGGG